GARQAHRDARAAAPRRARRRGADGGDARRAGRRARGIPHAARHARLAAHSDRGRDRRRADADAAAGSVARRRRARDLRRVPRAQPAGGPRSRADARRARRPLARAADPRDVRNARNRARRRAARRGAGRADRGPDVPRRDALRRAAPAADAGRAQRVAARDCLAAAMRIPVSSATLEPGPAAALLGAAPVVRTEGRTFPVETRYVGQRLPPMPAARSGSPRGPGSTLRGHPGAAPSAEAVVARTVARALGETDGDVLVFLPGAAEIRRVESLLDGGVDGVRVVPLYGDLDPAAQDAALAPSAPGERKIVLATNIAETSPTTEGVRVAVDSGLVRASVFDPATGMSRLETRRISRASAEQRQGRAGRTAPGVCYRVWSEAAQRSLAATTPPEILS